jgi:hypothetical protein
MIVSGLLLIMAVQVACVLPVNLAAPTTAPAAAVTATSPFGENSDNPGFCPANLATPAKSAVISAVTMAKNVEGDNKTPVDPTNEFSAADTLHTVVSIVDAPLGTRFKAEWIVVDIGDPSTCNTKIADYEIVTEGTRNIDFSLDPEPSWPVGSYKIELSINGVLDRVENYTIK